MSELSDEAMPKVLFIHAVSLSPFNFSIAYMHIKRIVILVEQPLLQMLFVQLSGG